MNDLLGQVVNAEAARRDGGPGHDLLIYPILAEMAQRIVDLERQLREAK